MANKGDLLLKLKYNFKIKRFKCNDLLLINLELWQIPWHSALNCKFRFYDWIPRFRLRFLHRGNHRALLMFYHGLCHHFKHYRFTCFYWLHGLSHQFGKTTQHIVCHIISIKYLILKTHTRKLNGKCIINVSLQYFPIPYICFVAFGTTVYRLVWSEFWWSISLFFPSVCSSQMLKLQMYSFRFLLFLSSHWTCDFCPKFVNQIILFSWQQLINSNF